MKPFRLILIIACTFLTVQSFSQDSGIEPISRKTTSKHRIGFAAGTTGGVGIMYAYKPGKLQIQGVAFPNVRPNNAYAQAGLSFTYDVKSYKYFDLFLFENNRLIYSKYSYTDYYYDMNGNYTTYVYKEESTKIAHGLGMGLRFDFLEHLGAQVMTGFAAYNYNQVSMCIDAGLYFIL